MDNLVWTFKQNDHIALRMHGALSCFYQLSPTTVFNKDVFDILENLLAYSGMKNYDRYNYSTTEEVFVMEFQAIDEDISKILHRLELFHYSFCDPIPLRELDYGSSYPRKALKKQLTNLKKMKDMSLTVMGQVKDRKTEFIGLFDKESGFCFDPISRTTRIIKNDLETVRRVERMKHLLENPRWHIVNTLKIIFHDNGTQPILQSNTVNIAAVTNKNVDIKIQIAHLFLSCKYNQVLIECVDHAILIWNQSKQTPDEIRGIKRFLGFGISLNNRLKRFRTTIVKSDPLLSLMSDALSFFYELAPEMKYNKEVFNIIKSFRTTFIVENVTLNVEKDMLEFLQHLHAFFDAFCKEEYLFYSKYDLELSPEQTMDIELLFEDKINYFIEGILKI